jgi:hypothetical protein
VVLAPRDLTVGEAIPRRRSFGAFHRTPGFALYNPEGFCSTHAGPYVGAAVAHPPDPVRPANHMSSRTCAYTAPRRSESRRDPVRRATTTVTWAAAGLIAARVAATLLPVPSLQPGSG